MYLPVDEDVQKYATSYLPAAVEHRPDGFYIVGTGDNGRVIGPIPPPIVGTGRVASLERINGLWVWRLEVDIP